MKELEDGRFDVEVNRLSAVLQEESASAFALVEEVMKNLNKGNIISFLTVMLYEKKGKDSKRRSTDGWKRCDADHVFEELYNIGIIQDNALKKTITSSSEVFVFLFISALERIAENLETFTQSALRAFWMTEDNICSNCGSKQSSESLYCKQCGREMENKSWDREIRRVTTEISAELMTKVKHRYYYIEKENEVVKGTFFKNNLISKDIEYLVESLKSFGLNVIDSNDRIHFEKFGKIDKGEDLVRSVEYVAKDLKFQRKKLSI